MNKREKIYVIIILILFGILLAKSFYFDEYKPVTEDEMLFKEYAQRLSHEKFKNNKLVGFKVVSIKKLEDKGISIIEVKSGNDNEYENVEIQGKYMAKIRKYLFHFLPYGEDKILSRK